MAIKIKNLRENIGYVFNGHSFRTEGIEPLDWTYMDGKYIKEIHSKYGDGDLSKFDNFYITDIIKFKIINYFYICFYTYSFIYFF